MANRVSYFGDWLTDKFSEEDIIIEDDSTLGILMKWVNGWTSELSV